MIDRTPQETLDALTEILKDGLEDGSETPEGAWLEAMRFLGLK